MTDADLLAVLAQMCNQHGVLTQAAIETADEATTTAGVTGLLERGRVIPEPMLRRSAVSPQKLSRQGYRRRQGLLYEVYAVPLPDEEPAKPKRKKKALDKNAIKLP